jgi:hypothetical protein
MATLVKKRITQATFDEVVRENIEELAMEGDEALADAITQFERQGVDLTNIMKRIPAGEGEEGSGDLPIIVVLRELSSLIEEGGKEDDSVRGLLDAKLQIILKELREGHKGTGSGAEGEEVGINVSTIAGANGGVTTLIKALEISRNWENTLVNNLNCLSYMLHSNDDNKSYFGLNHGSAELIISILNSYSENDDILDGG